MRINKQKIRFIKKQGEHRCKNCITFYYFFFFFLIDKDDFGVILWLTYLIFSDKTVQPSSCPCLILAKDPIFMLLAKNIEENLDVSTHWREVLFLFIWGVHFPHLSSFVKERAFDCRFSWIKLVRSNEVGLELVHTANNRRFHCTVLL